MTETRLSPDSIDEAARRIDPAFLRTPQFRDAALSRALGRDIVVKVETLNPLRSFKGRGADLYVRRLTAGAHVVCASAGNFGQAVAYAGRARSVPVTVFTAHDANPNKVARMRELGAEVVQTGRDFDEAKDAAREYAETRPELVFVEDGDEPLIAEGAGTIAVELAPLGLDTLLVPVGNGALISGIGCWTKARSPRTRIIGVCAASAPAMATSWRTGVPEATGPVSTMADGIAVRVPVPAAVDWMREVVDDVLLVEEEDILLALRTVRDTLGLLLEPSGAVGVAAALRHDLGTGSLGTILTGGNFSPGLLEELAPDPARADVTAPSSSAAR
ncbi:pyridoxal-phosphate dependent enzyme [Streptomyces ferrugineus]|uniref:Pyridoxal-phosphate dependent enzyme n=1 Tax=Streptomyces ferrugineus TaxID=1413221 RepID=A0A7M2SVK4_9ACTN|nr:pyridoxal-phosphate dependent enzyme [Streptomyces ferrugineus]QOV40396.1 pyridoxal-phosphate dependent enzyme [Streptomyces ferrugineus]